MDTQNVNIDAIEKELKPYLLKIIVMPPVENGYALMKKVLAQIKNACAESFILLSHYSKMQTDKENRIAFLLKEAIKREDEEILKCFESGLKNLSEYKYVYKDKEVDIGVLPFNKILNTVESYLNDSNTSAEMIEKLSLIKGYVFDIRTGSLCMEKSVECSLQRLEDEIEKTFQNTEEIKNLVGGSNENLSYGGVSQTVNKVPASFNKQEETKEEKASAVSSDNIKELRECVEKETESIKKEVSEKANEVIETIKQYSQNRSSENEKVSHMGAQPASAPVTEDRNIKMLQQVMEVLSNVDKKIEDIQTRLENVENKMFKFIEEDEKFMNEYAPVLQEKLNKGKK